MRDLWYFIKQFPFRSYEWELDPKTMRCQRFTVKMAGISPCQPVLFIIKESYSSGHYMKEWCVAKLMPYSDSYFTFQVKKYFFHILKAVFEICNYSILFECAFSFFKPSFYLLHYHDYWIFICHWSRGNYRLHIFLWN